MEAYTGGIKHLTVLFHEIDMVALILIETYQSAFLFFLSCRLRATGMQRRNDVCRM